MKPHLLDLFCGAGGAAMGYRRAGFDVTGVDIESQPRYPFEFRREDALDILGSLAGGFRRWIPDDAPHLRLDSFDAIHASPPCQAYTTLRGRQGGKEYPDLVAPTRELLRATGLPYVIENVVGAPLEDPTMLCGSALGLPLKRHRLFEASFPLMSPGCAHGQHEKRFKIRQHGREIDTAFAYVFGGGQAGQTAAEWSEAMGIDWMTVDELSLAIPPAYTEHIGGYLMAALASEAAA